MNFNLSDAIPVVMLVIGASTLLSSAMYWTALRAKKA